MIACPACRKEVPEEKFCDQCGVAQKTAVSASPLETHYSWQLSLLPARMDGELLMLMHQNLSKLPGVLSRMKLGRELAGKGLNQGILALSEELVERGARNKTLGKWAADILAGTGAAEKFAARYAGCGRPEFLGAYARAFAGIDKPDIALALLEPMTKSLGREDWPLYVAVYARIHDALPVAEADIPEDLRLAVAEALLDVRKAGPARDVLRRADRSKWGHRDYLKGIRAWYKVNDRVGAKERFKEAMVRFDIEEAPHLYYEYARFCEGMGDLAEAREIYKQLHAKQGTRCMVDAKTRLAMFDALSIHDSRAMNTVLALLQGDPGAADGARKKRGLAHKVIRGRFEVVELLGFGGMGEVYKAVDKKPGLGNRFVALKRIRDELTHNRRVVDQFIEEAVTLAKLQHPYILTFYDVKEDDGEFFLVCEYIDGETVQQTLHREGRLDPERCVSIIMDVCEGLTEAHGKGFIHRDLKPENIMVDHRGYVKLMDFGLARQMNLLAGVGGGTPPYMAPEQYDGHETRRSDLFSLGATLYAMVAGRMPFDGDDMRKDKLAGRYPALPNDVPAALRETVTACLKPDPGSRPESAQTVAEMLGKTVQAAGA